MKNHKLRQIITDAYMRHQDDNPAEPYAAEVSIVEDGSSDEKRVLIGIDVYPTPSIDTKPSDSVKLYHYCDEMANLIHLCDTDNGSGFVITKFHGFVASYGGWAFIERKIRQVRVTNLKIRPSSNKSDFGGEGYYVDYIRFTAAGLDKEFIYKLDGENNLPAYLRIFKYPETIMDLIDNGKGDYIESVFVSWKKEVEDFKCPLITIGGKLVYHTTDIEQELYHCIPKNMFFDKTSNGTRTVCAWKWNGYKPVFDTICDDDKVLVYDFILDKLNIEAVCNPAECYGSSQECSANNAIDIVEYPAHIFTDESFWDEDEDTR